jgi:putative ABC transport system permease protein
MAFVSRVASLARNLFTRRRVEQDLDRELQSYLDELTDEKRRSGMDAAAARRAARLELGGMVQVKEQVREVRTGQMMEELLQDLRYGLRTLRRNPAFTAVAVFALALGIGVNTAMFSVAYGVLLRPLPYPDADRIQVVSMRYFPRDFAFGTLCMRDYLMWREHNRAFEDPVLVGALRMDIGGQEGPPEQVLGANVTAGFFSTLGAPPLIGRTFAAGEDRPGAPSLAVLGESIWRRRFASNPGVLGRTILVNGVPSTVIGVVAAGFQFPRRESEVWTNLPLNPPTRYGPWFYRGLARLKRGITARQAQAELDQIALRMMEQNPQYKRLQLPIRSLRDTMLGATLKPAILVLLGAVGLVLLIAVVNVANLMLARASVREREMALRLSLGAGRGRVVRQLLVESVLLSGMGGLAGLLLAKGGVDLVHAWNPAGLPLLDSVRLDWTALAFTVVVSALTGILFGLVPARESARADLNTTLKEGGRGSAGAARSRGRMRSALVISEIAISLMLLVGAGLLIRSFVNLQRENGGFEAPPPQVATMMVSPANRKYRDPAAGAAFYDEVLRRARSVPGVEAASLTSSLPPDRQGDADTFGIEGQNLPAGELNPVVSDVVVTPDFFRTLRIPLVRGRAFDDHDTAASDPVAIVSEAFARRFFPGQAPLGQRIRASGPGSGNPWMRIVGVVGNVKYLGLTADTGPAYYMPFSQAFLSRMYLAVRTSRDAARVTGALRQSVRAADPAVTLAQLGTMEEQMQRTVSQPRFDTTLLALFAAIALLLAAVGIYGLIAYSVAQRTHEIGVRVALGAARADVVWMVVRQGAMLAAAGMAIGLAGAFALTRLLGTLVFGVGVTDAATFAAAPIALALVVLFATLVPAVRATRVSPIVALRYE